MVAVDCRPGFHPLPSPWVGPLHVSSPAAWQASSSACPSTVGCVQAGIAEVTASKHGIKVLLSLTSDSERHLPPHAVSMLRVPARTVTVASAADPTPGENGDATAEDKERTTADAAVSTELVQLGVSKKEPRVRRYDGASVPRQDMHLEASSANRLSLLHAASKHACHDVAPFMGSRCSCIELHILTHLLLLAERSCWAMARALCCAR